MNTTPDYDVAIAGAGPVGLFLACELALAQCSVLILEKAEHPRSPLKQLPFGIRGLSSPSIEALYRRDLLDELALPRRLAHLSGGSPRKQAGHFAGIPFCYDKIDSAQWRNRLPGSLPPSLISEMEEIETVLTRRAEALGVVIKRGLAVASFTQSEAGVTVQAGDHAFHAQWLVGCDGARSVVRKAGGFEFAGTEPEFTGYSAKVDIADPEKLRPGRNATPQGMYFQAQPGYLNLQDFDGGAFHHLGKSVTREHVQEVLRRISGTDVTVTALHIATTWTDRARQAASYRKGRVLLAGDAAHIHAPLGGQGLNLGLGDAMNLGWKLAATIRGRAPAGLLDSYHTERAPVGEKVLDWSRAQVAIMRPNPEARALQAIFRDLMDTRDGATYFAGRVWGVAMHYDLGAGHPLAGYSAPNVEFEDGTTIGECMRDGRAVLLDFGDDAENGTLADIASDYGIKYVRAAAKDRFGLSAVLIRPDSIVAWATEGRPDYDELQNAAGRWFARQPAAPRF